MTGNAHGPYTVDVHQKLLKIDRLIGYLIIKLKSNGLLSRINVILTSDHGIEKEAKKSHIYLEDYINMNLVDVVGNYSLMNLFLKNKSHLEPIYEKLKQINNINVYKKADIPENLNLKENISQIGDILLVSETDYLLILDRNHKCSLSKNFLKVFNIHNSTQKIQTKTIKRTSSRPLK